MVSVHEALETILDHAQPLGHETVGLTQARGRILATDILADADLPGMPRSSVDGYAVIAGDDAADFDGLSGAVVRELSKRRGVVVTNEVGMGIVPANELARQFRDVLGFVNTRFAEGAERAVLMVAGRAVELAPI